jgi:hypothetical protein
MRVFVSHHLPLSEIRDEFGRPVAFLLEHPDQAAKATLTLVDMGPGREATRYVWVATLANGAVLTKERDSKPDPKILRLVAERSRV